MRGLRTLLIRVRGSFFRSATEREMAAEFESHLQLHIDDNVRAGMTPAEARRAALLRFGPVEAVKDAYRDRGSLPVLDGILRDLRFACRSLRRRPGFTLAATVTLALGIGANTAVFSVVDAVLLRPLPYPEPERVVEITGPGQALVKFGRVLEVHPPGLRESAVFSAIGLYVAGGANLGGDPARRVNGAAVSPGFFAALGVEPLVGRTFDDRDIAASDRIVVISHRLWRERLLSDPLVVGRTMTLDGSAFTITGVMPPAVEFPAASEVWIPTNAPTALMGTIPAPRLIARLADGVNAAHARTEIVGLTQMKEPRASMVKVLPLREALVGAVRPVAVVIWIASGLVLLIACINAANLLLARVSGREREFAVRRALGASRSQLVRQVVVESLVLAITVAAMAVPAAIWTIEAGRVLLPVQLHGMSEVGIDGRGLIVTAAAAVLTAVLFGLGPCLSIGSTASGGPLRAQTAATVAPFWRRFRSALLVAEVAVTMLLLAGAGTLVVSVRKVMDVDIGARGERALAIELTLAGDRYSSPALRQAFFTQLADSVRRLHGVEAAGVSNQLPGRAAAMLLARPILLEGQAATAPESTTGIVMAASPGYFEASGIDLLAGRTFSDRDVEGGPPVVVVSEGYARTLGVAPQALIGARAGAAGTRRGGITLPPDEIVGVVRDVRLRGPEEPFDAAIYSPLAVNPGRSGSVYLVVRAAGDPRALVGDIRGAVRRLDPNLPLFNIRTFDEITQTLLAERRFAMMTMVTFGLLAFMLSLIGLYGVINYLVQLRTREIGIRLAIGATRARICSQVLVSGASHAVIGVVAGLALAAAVSGVLASKIRGMERMDPALLGALAVIVVLVATLAAFIPALRAMRIDPALTLRAE